MCCDPAITESSSATLTNSIGTAHPDWPLPWDVASSSPVCGATRSELIVYGSAVGAIREDHEALFDFSDIHTLDDCLAAQLPAQSLAVWDAPSSHGDDLTCAVHAFRGAAWVSSFVSVEENREGTAVGPGKSPGGGRTGWTSSVNRTGNVRAGSPAVGTSSEPRGFAVLSCISVPMPGADRGNATVADQLKAERSTCPTPARKPAPTGRRRRRDWAVPSYPRSCASPARKSC